MGTSGRLADAADRAKAATDLDHSYIVEAGCRACLEVMNRILRRRHGVSGPETGGSSRATI